MTDENRSTCATISINVLGENCVSFGVWFLLAGEDGYLRRGRSIFEHCRGVTGSPRWASRDSPGRHLDRARILTRVHSAPPSVQHKRAPRGTSRRLRSKLALRFREQHAANARSPGKAVVRYDRLQKPGQMAHRDCRERYLSFAFRRGEHRRVRSRTRNGPQSEA